MKLPDRLALIAALYFTVYFILCRSGCIAFASAIVSALCSACIYCAIRAAWDRIAKRRRKKSSVRSAAKRLLLSLSYMPEPEARGHIREWICIDVDGVICEENERGLICKKDGKKIFIGFLFRHPESGPVRAEERQQVRRDARAFGIEEVCLISLSLKGDPCADPDLDSIQMIDGDDLVSLFVRHEERIPPHFFETEGSKGRKRTLLFLLKPPTGSNALRSMGYAAMLLPGWLFSRNPLFLLGIAYQLYICIYALVSRKKQAHAKLFR